MGYRRPTVNIKLTFEDDSFDGLEVTCRATSVGEFLRAVGLTAGGLPFIPANEGRLHTVCNLVMDTVIEWNLEDDEGKPVPATTDSLLAQDRAFLKGVIDAWMEAQVEVPGPLGKKSSSGEVPNELASLPTVALPASLVS